MTPRERAVAMWRRVPEHVLTAAILAIGGGLLTAASVAVKDHATVQTTAARVDTLTVRANAADQDRREMLDILHGLKNSSCLRENNPISREDLKCPSTLSPSAWRSR